MYHIAPETELSPLACAYARGADRMSSFGDWIALSDVCDLSTAKLIQHGLRRHHCAGYDADALEVLKSRRRAATPSSRSTPTTSRSRWRPARSLA